jgi:serine/threonine protein kinase/tetratricopeptide (TPR) repeat protein
MPGDDSSLLKLAGAVADGGTVEWHQEESAASGEHKKDIIRQLEAVAAVAGAYQDLPAQETIAVPGGRGLSVPSAWGRLEIRREIGRGGFGTVYLAWDAALERDVALKVLRADERSEAVVQEGRLLARVRHPNVVMVYGVDEYEGTVGLWMELVEGLTLNQILAARGVMGGQEAALVGVDICRAVAAMHKAGLLHRDIKAQNVMREAGGRIVLMDLGAGEVRTDRISSAPHLRGTPLYLAPELFDNKPATIASDVYSLGVLLYHLVTMRYPVEGDTFEAVGAAHASGRFTPVSDHRPDLPAGLTRVIGRALERDPARRYRSSAALQEDLASVAHQDGPGSSSDHAVTRSNSPREPSMAVLPFENLGPDQDLEYFCTGLAEELLTGLAKVEGLRVASRTSSSHVKQRETDIRRICRLLDVDAVLEGTVRKAGERLRITAQLVSANDGCHLWSEGYDRSVADVFAVQDEIAQSVVDRLKISLAQFPRRQLIRQHTQNPRAYQFYLKGRFFWTRRFHGGFQAALEHFQKAIEEDAAYALAYAGLADAYSFMATYAVQKPRIAFAHALAAAERALALDPDLAEAHTSVAWIRLGDWNWPEAEREFRRALELDPTQALSRIYHSWLMVLQGDIAGAMIEARKAQEIEPLSPLVNAGTGHTLFLARRYDEAIAECEKSLEVDPNFILGIHVIGMCRALQSRLTDAIEIGERTVSMSGRAPFYVAVLGHYYARSGATEKVREIIEELERVSSTRYVGPHSFAYIYAGTNDLDRAFEWQAKAYEDGASPFFYFAPLIDNLQADPRHAAELRRVGLNRNLPGDRA